MCAPRNSARLFDERSPKPIQTGGTAPELQRGRCIIGIILGVDLGGSTTKLIGLSETGERFGALQISASRPEASACGAVGTFLMEQQLPLEAVEHIAVTGVGASVLPERMYGIPVQEVPEFTAIGRGGLILSEMKEALVVSMGTGTAFVRASEKEGFLHIGGSGVGGGTISGLCGRLAGVRHFNSICSMARRGNLEQVDLMVDEIFKKSGIQTLPSHLTAANFGKWSDMATGDDTALGVLNLVFQTIGMLAVFACRNDTVKDVVLVGTLTEILDILPTFEQLSELHGIRFLVPDQAVHATALGAAMSI